MRNKILKLLAIAAVGSTCWFGCGRRNELDISNMKWEIKPPPTLEELSRFRIVTNQFGLIAVQRLDGTNWSMCANRFNDESDWLIQKEIEFYVVNRLRVQPPRDPTLDEIKEAASVWRPK